MFTFTGNVEIYISIKKSLFACLFVCLKRINDCFLQELFLWSYTTKLSLCFSNNQVFRILVLPEIQGP